MATKDSGFQAGRVTGRVTSVESLRFLRARFHYLLDLLMVPEFPRARLLDISVNRGNLLLPHHVGFPTNQIPALRFSALLNDEIPDIELMLAEVSTAFKIGLASAWCGAELC